MKKKRTGCKKKPVRKQWLEDLVVNEVMKVVMDDQTIEAIVSMVMDLQDRENTNLPLYEHQLQEAQRGIDNLLNAIQQGILTKSTKTRLEELEAAKEDLEIKIANEKIVRPRISPEFVTFWLHKFRKLDVRQQPHRKMLIDAFVNAIYLYDDKLVLTFNYKDGTRTIDWDDVKEATQKADTGSDLDCRGAPNKVDSFDTKVFETINLFLFAKILAAQGFSAKRHFGIVSLCALWITLLETATVHADNRITFRFKDGTDIEVGAE